MSSCVALAGLTQLWSAAGVGGGGWGQRHPLPRTVPPGRLGLLRSRGGSPRTAGVRGLLMSSLGTGPSAGASDGDRVGHTGAAGTPQPHLQARVRGGDLGHFCHQPADEEAPVPCEMAPCRLWKHSRYVHELGTQHPPDCRDGSLCLLVSVSLFHLQHGRSPLLLSS